MWKWGVFDMGKAVVYKIERMAFQTDMIFAFVKMVIGDYCQKEIQYILYKT